MPSQQLSVNRKLECPKCPRDIDRRATKSFLECEICERNFHDSCFGIPMEAVKLLRKSDYLVCCASCNDGCRGIISRLAKLELRVEQCETDFAEAQIAQNNLMAKQDEMGSRIASLEKDNKESKDQQIIPFEEILKELEERRNRSCNLKFTNIPESTSPSIQDRVNADKQAVIDFAVERHVIISMKDIKKCYRVGKTTETGRPRPLGAHFFESSIRSQILNQAAIVRRENSQRSLAIPWVGVSPDLTSKQQIKLREAYQEANAKNTNENESGESG